MTRCENNANIYVTQTAVHSNGDLAVVSIRAYEQLRAVGQYGVLRVGHSLTSLPGSPAGPVSPGGPTGPGGPRSPLPPAAPCFPGSP